MRIIDLTGAYEEGMWRYGPEFPPFESAPAATVEKDGFRVNKVTISTHMGTHVDAPGHLLPNGDMVDTMPLDLFVGPAAVLRINAVSELEKIGKSRLEEAGKALQRGDIALVETGWSRHWNEEGFVKKSPHLTLDAAEWLLDQGVKCVGYDMPVMMDPTLELKPDQQPQEELPDELLLKHNIPCIGGLTNLSGVRSDRVFFIGLPMKLKGADGSPTRCIVLEDVGFPV